MDLNLNSQSNWEINNKHTVGATKTSYMSLKTSYVSQLRFNAYIHVKYLSCSCLNKFG